MTSVTLTGRVVEERREAQQGDIVLSACLSSAGRRAVEGGHTNYGYSGFWRPFVCVDGAFKRMYVDDFLPYRYETQGEKEEAFERVVEMIATLAGKTYDLSKQMPPYERGPGLTPIESVKA